MHFYKYINTLEILDQQTNNSLDQLISGKLQAQILSLETDLKFLHHDAHVSSQFLGRVIEEGWLTEQE